MVEDGRLGRPCVSSFVVRRDGMEELREDVARDSIRPLLDQPQAQVDVSQEATLRCGEEQGPAIELP